MPRDSRFEPVIKTPPPPRGFETTEFEQRLFRAQHLMADEGYSGLLLMTEAEIRYFTGFQTLFWQSPTRPWFLFLPIDGKPVAVIPEIGAALMQRTWIDDIRTWNSPQPDDEGISLLLGLLSSYEPKNMRLGIMKGHETQIRMPLADLESLQAGLPGLVIGDCTKLVQTLRMQKSAAEIEKIRHVCAIVSATFDQADGLFHVGQPLIEAFRSFRIACLAEGADDVPYLVGGAGRGGYGDIISPPSSRLLQTGDVMMLDTGSVYDGYYCDFDRNFAVRHADDPARRAYDVLYEATQAGLDAARPGTMCRDLFQAMHKVTSTLGNVTVGAVGRFGHGLGMQLTECPSHAEFDETVLKPGMVITLEPSVSYGPGLMMVHEENIVVRDGEPELLSRRAAPELPVISRE